MSEAQLVKKIMDQLKANEGGLWIKISAGPFQFAGLPDIIGCCNGKFFGIEVKLPGKENTLTKLQIHWLNMIREAGGKAMMVTTVQQALKFVKDEK